MKDFQASNVFCLAKQPNSFMILVFYSNFIMFFM